jgi:dTDP-glucose 4,6-dehydratase
LLDSSRAKKELGWNPAISLEEGIQETIDWVTNNFDELKKQPFDYIHKP